MRTSTREATTLADGRELYYFDDAHRTPPHDPRPADARELDARPPTPTMRFDPLSGDWVSVATARQQRVMLPPAHLDPLAPQSPGNPSEIPGDYDVAVFENRSPSFGPDLATAPPERPLGIDDASVFGVSAPATGRCEVICFSPDSEGSLASQDLDRMETVVDAWVDRVRELSALPGIEQVFPFENRGEHIGVTLHHPHGQIYGYPYVTPRTRRTLERARAHAGDLFQDMLDYELQHERVVLRGDHWTAFVPFAARWPIEVTLLPHRHVPDLAATDAAERAELAQVYRTLLRAVDARYDNAVPYIAAWHQAPVRVGRDDVRLRLEVVSPQRGADKMKYLAGSEAAMGAWVSDVSPEASAAALRAAVAAQ